MTAVLSIVSLAFAATARSINVAGLVRRPRIIAEWGPVQDEPHWYEGLAIVVTARRRSIEVDEIGIVLLPKKTRRRRAPSGCTPSVRSGYLSVQRICRSDSKMESPFERLLS